MPVLSIKDTVTLNNGIRMPVLGLGMWKMSDGEETVHAVDAALEAGYRLIDTATFYGNERSVGQAVRESGIPRDEIFVTTKLWPTDFGNPRKAFEESRERLGLEYIDLYLIHWPGEGMQSVWQALEDIYRHKLARAIGISNFRIGDIQNLLTYADVPPAVNQVKFNPFSWDEELLEFCSQKRIITEAYSPLAQGSKMRHPTIETVAEKYSRSPAQIMIRWALQHGTVVIPKSGKPKRIAENADVFDFELSVDDMRALDTLA